MGPVTSVPMNRILPSRCDGTSRLSTTARWAGIRIGSEDAAGPRTSGASSLAPGMSAFPIGLSGSVSVWLPTTVRVLLLQARLEPRRAANTAARVIRRSILGPRKRPAAQPKALNAGGGSKELEELLAEE